MSGELLRNDQLPISQYLHFSFGLATYRRLGVLFIFPSKLSTFGDFLAVILQSYSKLRESECRVVCLHFFQSLHTSYCLYHILVKFMKPSSFQLLFRVKQPKKCQRQCCSAGRVFYGCLYLDWAAPDTI